VSREDWIIHGKKLLMGGLLMDITEYGRAAHAEMEALLSCARSGVSTRGCTLYSTTFPCHNCAKHIIAAGIARVVYVEPYPKSQASDLFGDSIRVHGIDDGRVAFTQFVGVGARRFIDLFSMALSSGTVVKRKRRGGLAAEWSPEKATVRVPVMPNCYLDREQVAEQELDALTTKSEGST
jgi:deoxycytidylate deaminase